MSLVNLWGFQVSTQELTFIEREYLQTLPSNKPSVEWIWQEMNKVWLGFNLDNKLELKSQKISEFYSHPIWLVNGIFTALDEESIGHRKKIAEFLKFRGAIDVADFGGGFGELALQIHYQNPGANITVIEPYPSKVGLQRIRDISKIKQLPRLSEYYEVIIAQDVLEHVEDPVALAYEICQHVNEQGIVIFANCFFPMIECHLPRTFHLRNTFFMVMSAMGMAYIGVVPGVNHAHIYRKKSVKLNMRMARYFENVSKVIGPQLNACRSILSKIKSR